MTDIKDVLNEREKTHGDFNRVATASQGVKAWLTQGPRYAELTQAQKEALDMIASKLARIVCGNPDEPDHWRDIAGYATLVERGIPIPPAASPRDPLTGRCCVCGAGRNEHHSDVGPYAPWCAVERR